MTTTTTAPMPEPGVARPRRKFKWRYLIALAVCVGAIAWMITSLSENVNYLETVSQAVKHRAGEQHRELRIGGVVVRHTLQRTGDGADFRLGDGKAIVFVHVTNIPSQLFAECAPVVVQGQWNGTSFAGDNLLVRHGANYGASNGKDVKTIKDALAGTGCQKPT
jgi:cytochrome c-type biogenesis protein CcmE